MISTSRRVHRPFSDRPCRDGEETGGGAQGQDAIWSHRWFAFRTCAASPAPAGTRRRQARSATAALAWRLHVQPENGGLGVFAHEFGHDLGLPDQYEHRRRRELDRFLDDHVRRQLWREREADIGYRPVDFGAWEKLQLGWLNVDVSAAAQRSTSIAWARLNSTPGRSGLWCCCQAASDGSSSPTRLTATWRGGAVAGRHRPLDGAPIEVPASRRSSTCGELRHRGGLGLCLRLGVDRRGVTWTNW